MDFQRLQISRRIFKFTIQDTPKITACYNEITFQLSREVPDPVIDCGWFLYFINDHNRIRCVFKVRASYSDRLINRIFTDKTILDLISQILIFFKEKFSCKVEKIYINFSFILFICKFIYTIRLTNLTCARNLQSRIIRSLFPLIYLFLPSAFLTLC